MSVIVFGMKMPKGCGNCSFRGGSFGTYCKAKNGWMINDTKENIANSRDDGCPLVALPDKHGRLIDESSVKTDVLSHLGIKDESYLLSGSEKVMWDAISNAPTVIESEE